ncbi:MAG TPA: type II secretion system protein GspM [Spirochaetota bacterium]|nr:type II secretion system protein GspM [Spirochaetota bacterium]HNT10685.1 type II secretion system protein GspM [Spirochaetota bacterium]HNV46910.1 type II secretion system protein GspM [Spirochaetota bacterium]HPU89789.1 type II secretion system protein GspM [Spirochaetota bacterium]
MLNPLKNIKLSTREKIMLQALAGVIAVAVLYLLIIAPFIEFRESSDSALAKNVERLKKIDKIYDDYRELKREKSKYDAMLAQKNENITSLIEQWSNSVNIARNIAYTRRTQANIQNKYVRVTTDVKFEGVSIEKFLKFIYEVENSNRLIKLSYIRINTALKGTNTYDIVLKIDSFTAQ